MIRPPRKPAFWLACWLLWAATLWWLSSRVIALPVGGDIPNIDKVYHAGYFFGGAGLLAAFLFRLRPATPNWAAILLITIAIGILVGRLDEFHQAFTPGRSANDIDDLTADIIGTFLGALTFRKLHRLLLP